jgi:hypothetical protein
MGSDSGSGGTGDTTSDLSPFGPSKSSPTHTGGASSRKSSFQNYQKQREAAKKGIDITITPKEAETVRDNVSLAMDFEKKAKESKINIPGTTGIALSTVQSINYSNIASGLRGGGFAVKDARDGEVVGVVQDGRYSGNVGFDPTGRSKGASFDPDANQYSVSSSSSNEGSENNNVTPSSTSSTATNMTNSTSSPSLSTASRRALISGSGGSAARRTLL